MIVYRHIRLDKNEPFYIGIGKSVKRAYCKYGRNAYWKNIVKNTEYEVEILFEDLTLDEACEKEKEFIKLYGRRDIETGCLCNMTDGGDGTHGAIPWNKGSIGLQTAWNKGISPTEETKQKMSESRTGKESNSKGKLRSEESKQKMKKSFIGRVPWNKGKKLSDEYKKKLSESHIGKSISDDTKQKMSVSQKKRRESEKER